MATNLTQERLKEVYEYIPESGLFIRKIRTSPRVQIGEVAGTLVAEGYIQIGIDGKQYRAHRLAWFYMTGQWPTKEIDHKNTCRSDNRWINLREANRLQNSQNKGISRANTSGFKGVTWTKHAKKWRAHIRVNGEGIHLGYFKTPEEASAAYTKAAEAALGEYHHD